MVYSINKAAEILNFHPKTVLRFIHEGKIKARKAGGQWRILEEDLQSFIGNNEKKMSSSSIKPENGDRDKIFVSSVVDIYVESRDEALRISNSIIATINVKDPKYGFSRCDFLFFEDELKARFLLWGTPLFMSEIMKCFEILAS